MNLASIFDWLRWIQWISAFRYATDMLTINEFQGLKLCLPNQTNICTAPGESVLNDRGIAHDTAWDMWENFFILTVMAAAFFVFTYIRLRIMKKTK